MKGAIIFAYIFIAVLAVVVFMQWRTIQKLIPAPPVNNGGNNPPADPNKTAKFKDIIAAVQEQLKNEQPQEINIKLQ